MERKARVIFDSLGNVTLQLNSWAHHYHDAAEAAEDVATWNIWHDTDGWGGNEVAARKLKPTTADVKNNIYAIWDIGADYDTIKTWNATATEFFKALERRQVQR